ncbi:hypothetical protein J437_LFUL010781 [Ladona fulva]|uniref:SDE2-like domain-containing protein n=1 Tax=Ladona fulva TaxID=123851 RepID=A0A8K0K9I5_LADFU|nr:hypothetical protein J437_LFUL010781 [Ladona fulva]
MSYLEVSYPKKCYILPESPLSLQELKAFVNTYGGLDAEAYYFTHNGKLVRNNELIADGVIYAVPRLLGGKGGFGSMLRAIGAQIEKTTNREACRDLSGRRLRDINEEKRLKNWIAQQADREREAADKRRKKLERMVAEPKHEFEDKEYDKQRSELLEKVWDAVEQGVKASTSAGPSTSRKRSLPEPSVKTKKTRLWVDDIEDESVSSSCDSDESEAENTKSSKNIPKKETDKDKELKTKEASCSQSDAKEFPPKNDHSNIGSDKSSEEDNKLQGEVHPSEVNEKRIEDSPPIDGIKQASTG